MLCLFTFEIGLMLPFSQLSSVYVSGLRVWGVRYRVNVQP